MSEPRWSLFRLRLIAAPHARLQLCALLRTLCSYDFVTPIYFMIQVCLFEAVS